MKQRTLQKIQQQLENIEERLRNAEAYVARNENVESTSFLHFKDWEGQSGHPLWMKNFIIPATKRKRARKEKALERIVAKQRERESRERKEGPGVRSSCHSDFVIDSALLKSSR